MFTNHLFTLNFVRALGMRYAAKLLLTASILAGIGRAALPDTRLFTYTSNGTTVVRRSELGPWTGPGHDFGVIGSASDPGMSLPTSNAFTYTSYGTTVVRRSELGPMTETVDNSIQAREPGQDLDPISAASNLAISLPVSKSFTYTLPGGSIVVRRSELGPLTETVDNSLQARVPGQGSSPLGSASIIAISLPDSKPFTYTLPSGSIVVRRSELGPLTETVDNALQGRGPGHDYGVLDVDADQRLSCLVPTQSPGGWRRVC